jgi:hypothetical protein
VAALPEYIGFPVALWYMITFFALIGLAFSADVLSLPIQLWLRRRWRRVKKRREIKEKMLKVIKKSNGQHEWEPLQLVEPW